MKSKSLFSMFIFVMIFAIGLAVAYSKYDGSNIVRSGVIAVVSFVFAIIISSSKSKIIKYGTQS